MSTATVAPSPSVVTEREDYTVGFDLETKDVNGKPTVVKTAAYFAVGDDKSAEAVKALVAAGKFEEVYIVTASLPLAKSFDGIKQICPSEEEACNNFNRGAKQKASNRLKAKLLDMNADGNFTFGEADLTNGVYDLAVEIASETKRKSLTEEEKLDRFLEQFPEAIRNSMKAAYQSAKTA